MDDKAGTIREVNDGIALAAEDFLPGDPTESWTFLCECGEPACQEWVPLDLPAFQALRAQPDGAVLADGHVRRAREERARSEALSEEAGALRAQAQQQVRRARKQLDDR